MLLLAWHLLLVASCSCCKLVEAYACVTLCNTCFLCASISRVSEDARLAEQQLEIRARISGTPGELEVSWKESIRKRLLFPNLTLGYIAIRLEAIATRLGGSREGGAGKKRKNNLILWIVDVHIFLLTSTPLGVFAFDPLEASLLLVASVFAFDPLEDEDAGDFVKPRHGPGPIQGQT